jgi:3-hydroxyacyl-CoA dehydrogenase/enoyl-CoA hydratase/3-hydroxybutyryl-CoA epimerase
MFIEAALTDVSKNLIHVFDLTEMVKKQSGVSDKSVTARDVKGLGILGAGTMGGGIAFIAADKGVEARMKDLNFEAIGKGLKHARDIWAKALKKKRINKFEMQQKLDKVTGTLDFSGFKQLDVVVEAIVEDM